jgi:hypothetical protein
MSAERCAQGLTELSWRRSHVVFELGHIHSLQSCLQLSSPASVHLAMLASPPRLDQSWDLPLTVSVYPFLFVS